MNILFKYIFLFLILLSVGCYTPIKKILKNPAKYNKKSVRIRGVVINSLELEDFRAFTLKDRTGKIYVSTNSFLPVVGDKVSVKGKVIHKFTFQRTTMPIIAEYIKASKDTIPVPPVNIERHVNKKYEVEKKKVKK